MSIALGNSTSIDTAFGTSVTSSGITTSATSSTLVVGAWGGKSFPVITDSNLNVWVPALTQAFNGINGFASLYYVQNATGGVGQTFTATQTLGGGIGLVMVEITGAVLSGGPSTTPLDADATGATSTVPGQALNPSAANSMVLDFIGGAGNGSGAPTSGGGIWTMIKTLGTTNFVPAGASYSILASASSVNDTFTFPGQTSYDMAVMSISFAQAGAAGGTTATRLLYVNP